MRTNLQEFEYDGRKCMYASDQVTNSICITPPTHRANRQGKINRDLELAEGPFS